MNKIIWRPNIEKHNYGDKIIKRIHQKKLNHENQLIPYKETITHLLVVFPIINDHKIGHE